MIKLNSTFVAVMGIFMTFAVAVVMCYNSYRTLIRYWNGSAQVLGIEDESPAARLADAEKARDMRVIKLKKFFIKYQSPLAPLAKLVVDKADENSIDYRLIPAIALSESTLCKAIIPNSFNCWGWGIYDNKVTKFNSFEDAIDVISRGIKKNYYDKGLSDPADIMKVYTPSSEGTWAKKVNWAFDKIDAQ